MDNVIHNIYELCLKLNLTTPTQIKISIDPKVYPFIPPKFQFITPCVRLPLASSLMNLKILKSAGLIQGEIVPPKINFCINRINLEIAKILITNFLK